MVEKSTTIYIACEGLIDAVLAEKLIEYAIGPTVTVERHTTDGKAKLKKRINGYNNAAHHSLWFVLVDLDNEICAPELRNEWFSKISEAAYMCFTVAVREAEAWLLADRDSIAKFLYVAREKIPIDPEKIEKPKEFLVELARKSKAKSIREHIPPRPGSGRQVGPGYTKKLIDFVSKQWNIETARKNSNSLDRAIDRIKRVSTEYKKAFVP